MFLIRFVTFKTLLEAMRPLYQHAPGLPADKIVPTVGLNSTNLLIAFSYTWSRSI